MIKKLYRYTILTTLHILRTKMARHMSLPKFKYRRINESLAWDQKIGKKVSFAIMKVVITG